MFHHASLEWIGFGGSSLRQARVYSDGSMRPTKMKLKVRSVLRNDFSRAKFIRSGWRSFLSSQASGTLSWFGGWHGPYIEIRGLQLDSHIVLPT